MNHPLARASAKALVERPEVAAEADIIKRIDRLYRLTYGRPPTAEEAEWGRSFLADSGATPLAWIQYAQALLMANEFAFID
jgi:hypothetical protein